MTKRKLGLVIAQDRDTALSMTALASGLAGEICVVAIDAPEAAVNAPRAWTLSTAGAGFLSAVRPVERLVRELRPDLVIADTSRNGRLIAAHCAACLGTCVITDATDIRTDGDRLTARRTVYGGGAYKTVCTEAAAVLCVGPGCAEPGEARSCAEVSELHAELPEGVEFVGRDEREVHKVGLAGAKIVLGLGRGVKSGEDLEAAERFARLIGAELGCTRPVAEEEGLLPRERYIGVSGAEIKPALYIAAGISGQIQHMAGIAPGGTVIAINRDGKAPVFENCDYGIVGDMYEVMDALSEKLS